MGKEVPKANDEAFGIEAAERNTYWCNLAMVRADHQGNGIAKAMFGLAFKEVSYPGLHVKLVLPLIRTTRIQASKTGATVALTTTNIRNVGVAVPVYNYLDVLTSAS